LNESTRTSIRRIFLSRQANFSLITAAALLGVSFRQLKRDVADGVILTVSTGVGERVSREEMVAAAMRVWDHATIEDALGREGVRVLPEAIRLVELRARIPRYQRDMLRYLAQCGETTVDQILARELDDVASEYSEELAGVLPGFAEAFV